MLADVALHVHRHEGGQLHEAGIDLPASPRMAIGHGGDQLLLEPRHGLGQRQLVDLGRRRPGVHRPAHQGHGARLGGVLVLGHQGDGGQGVDARLAHRHHMRPRAHRLQELHDVVDIVVKAEGALAQRHVPGVGPVGDVDVVVAQQRLDRAAQQGGEMARQRRHQKHLGLGRLETVLGEMDQIAEGQPGRHLLDHRIVAVADPDAVDAEGRTFMGDLGAVGDLQQGEGAAGQDHAVGRHRAAQSERRPRRRTDRSHRVRPSLIPAV